MRIIILWIVIFLWGSPTIAQKVGLVFSGGGAKGLAHIGVLKALEEHHIPIDYIVGTSMGGIIGGMYAAGYTPLEIEAIAMSKNMKELASGNFLSPYSYFFRKKPDAPSFLTLKFQVDTTFRIRIRSTLVNDTPLNFAFLEYFSHASANAGNDFDKLFVPFRCVVADVVTHTYHAIREGNLANALRATCSVPFIFRPIKINNKYVFDGGLYNNFPVDVLKQDFTPDYIIGCNVSSKTFNEYPKDDEKLLNQFALYMFLASSDSTGIGDNGVYIQPDIIEYSPADFSNVVHVIQKGYDATLAKIAQIKQSISRTVDPIELENKRMTFKARKILPISSINGVVALGVNQKQKKYIETFFRRKSPQINLKNIKKAYYGLISDDNFETVYPTLRYQHGKKYYNFELEAQPYKNFRVDVGGVVSSRPINNVYLGFQYNFLARQGYTFSASIYSGGFYESIRAGGRVDFSTRLPLAMETEYVYNSWDYFDDSKLFIEKLNPIFIQQNDQKMVYKLSAPLWNNGKIETQIGYSSLSAKYSPSERYRLSNTLDFTQYRGFTAGIAFSKNTLNRVQYASRGIKFQLGFNYYRGQENYTPGDIFKGRPGFAQIVKESTSREWKKLDLSSEHYVITSKFYHLGYLLQAVWSDKPFFSTYRSTLMSAPAFYPMQDSRSVFLQNFKATSYGALGLKNILNVYKNVEMRLEGYVFQPVRAFQLSRLQSTEYDSLFSTRRYAATVGLVYHSLIGPVSISFNHYDDPQKRNGVIFHIGLLLYNKTSLE